AAKDTQARGAQAHDAWAKAQAPNRNRPTTHHPPKTALNRPSFLIDNPELEIELSYTKQMLALISNRQFFAVLKLPDPMLRVSPCHAERLRRARPASRKSVRTTANGGRLIGNDMHSPARATALQCATSIFLIGNEFHLWCAGLQRTFARQSKRRRASCACPPRFKRKAPRSQNEHGEPGKATSVPRRARRARAG